MVTKAAIATGTLPKDGTAHDWSVDASWGTPDCGIFFSSYADDVTNPRDGFQLYMGLDDGTTSYSVTGLSGDNLETTETDRFNQANALNAGGSLKWDAAYAADKVTMSLTAGTTSIERRGFSLLLTGVTNQAAGVVNLGTGTSPLGVTTGFKPDLVFFICDGTPSGTSAVHNIWSFGVAHNSSADVVSMGCLAFASRDGVGTADIDHIVRSDAVASQHLWSGTTWYCTAESFATGASDNFTLTPSASASSDRVWYLAIELADPDDAYVGIIDSHTVAENKAYTGVGFTPDVVLLAGSTNTALGTGAGTGAMFVGGADGTRELGVSCRDEEAAGTSNASSYADTSNLVHCEFDDATQDAIASLSSLDSDGFTLNFSDASASARKWLAVCVGDSTAAGGLGIPIAAYHYNHNVGANL